MATRIGKIPEGCVCQASGFILTTGNISGVFFSASASVVAFSCCCCTHIAAPHSPLFQLRIIDQYMSKIKHSTSQGQFWLGTRQGQRCRCSYTALKMKINWVDCGCVCQLTHLIYRRRKKACQKVKLMIHKQLEASFRSYIFIYTFIFLLLKNNLKNKNTNQTYNKAKAHILHLCYPKTWNSSACLLL